MIWKWIKCNKAGILPALLIGALCACSLSAQSRVSADGNSVLIVYLSRTNNTKAVAEMIQEKVGGELVALELVNPYPENYRAIVRQVQEENESGFLPPLKTKIPNLEQYDTMFVGFPTWGMQLPPPMKSFLTENSLEGKVVIPFNTNAGYGIGSSFETINSLCPKAEILEGFSVKGGIERDGVLFVMEGEKARKIEEELIEWLREIEVLKKQN